MFLSFQIDAQHTMLKYLVLAPPLGPHCPGNSTRGYYTMLAFPSGGKVSDRKSLITLESSGSVYFLFSSASSVLT